MVAQFNHFFAHHKQKYGSNGMENLIWHIFSIFSILLVIAADQLKIHTR
jgi:hypothetical protein